MKKYILYLVIVILSASGEAFPKLTKGISHHDSTANNLAAIDGHYGGSTSEQTKERPTLPRRSPDTPPDLKRSGTIVFSSSQNGNQEIYLLDLSTGRQTNLTNNRFDDGYPRLSPDGKKIAFATNRDGSWEVYLMNADGSDQRNLTRNREGNGYMDWSPDSQSLVFASTRYGNKNNDIYTIRADGSGLKRLTNHPAEDVHPVWSPDGRRIAFASERDGNREIYLMNTDGTNLIRLTNNRWYDDYPAWSPDGAQIAFASDRDSGRSDRLDIYTMNANGLNVRRVISDPADDRHPAWSPDGKMVAFVSDREGDRDIFVTRTDGTSLIWLVSSRGNDEHPHWNTYSQVMGRSRREDPTAPPIPFEDQGACPFECCTYRTWFAKKETIIRQDKQDDSPIAFKVRKGERVTGLTGVVIITKPGQARVLKPIVIGGTRVNAGSTLYLLTNLGEGFCKVWYRGKIFEAEIYQYDDKTVQIISDTESTWWVKIKNSKGKTGWSRQPENFRNIDACG